MAKRKAGRGIGYDIATLSDGNPPPLSVTPLESKAITNVFGSTKPSPTFLAGFEKSVASFVCHVTEMDKVTPARVGSRVEGGIQTHADKLLRELNEMNLTEHGIIDRMFTNAFLADRPCISVNEFRKYLQLFIQHTNDAVADFKGSPKIGRMPGHAEKALAFQIFLVIRDETGSPPSLYRNGMFSKVLKVALDMGDARLNRHIGKPRADVVALMNYAKNLWGANAEELVKRAKSLWGVDRVASMGYQEILEEMAAR